VATKVWWLAINKNDNLSSYEEIKERKIVALFYPEIDDLTPILDSYREDEEQWFDTVQKRQDSLGASDDLNAAVKYGARALRYLLRSKAGDLVVAIEGTDIRGICQIDGDSMENYRYEKTSKGAHIVADGIKWYDLPTAIAGLFAVSSRGVQGARQMHDSAQLALEIWEKLIAA
jgi:hypothetical protein